MTRASFTLAALALALTGVAADCQQCQPPPPARGNLDLMTDAVLVDGDVDGDTHTYLVATNPELQHLRVMDLTEETYVHAPNRFFALSIPVGAETRRIATAPNDESRVFALDTAEDTVFVVGGAEGKSAFARIGDGVATARAPADVCAWRASDTVFEVFVTVPDRSELQILEVNPADGTGVEAARITLLQGAHPTACALTPDGRSVLVTDAVLDVVHVIDRASRAVDALLSVEGPQGVIDVGVVDVGDGLAPVAVVLRTDAAEAWTLRLAREGYREDRYQVLGGAELPSPGVAAYVPDQRPSTTVCCRGLGNDAVDVGEATGAFFAVTGADGILYYGAVRARADAGDRTVTRLIDDDVDALAALTDLNTEDNLWVPAAGGENRRPVDVTLTSADTYGDPPLVPLIALAETLLLTWDDDAFEVEDGNGFVVGRLGLAPGDSFVHNGYVLTARASAAGNPLNGSKLSIPIDPHVTPMGLVLSGNRNLVTGGGSFADNGLFPVAILGRTMRFPDPTATGEIQKARRMAIVSGNESGGFASVITCDDAETIPDLCIELR